MATTAETFTLALRYHQAGNLAHAEQLYRQILQADPCYADSHHMLGVLACQQGRNEQAVACIQQALALAPDTGVYHANLGVANEALGRFEAALANYEHALRLRPGDADSHYNLANVLRRMNKLDEAVCHYGEALRLKPDFAQAHCNLGLALAAQGRLEEAVTHYQDALQLNSRYAEAHINLGVARTEQGRLDEAVTCFQEALRIAPNFAEAHHSLGCALQRQGKLDEAVRYFQRAIQLKPDYAPAYNDLGYVLERQDKFDDAVYCYQQALRINPHYAEALDNFGNALDRLDRLEEAIGCYQQALAIKPDCPETLNDLATVRTRQGKFDEALAVYDRALSLKPGLGAALLNRSLLQLLLGNFEQGWTDFDWRSKQPGIDRREFAQPLWDGSALNGRTILLSAEQGLGDTMQFIRYVPLVKQRGASVIVECQPVLVPLLKCFAVIDHLLAQGSTPPPFDVHAPLLSLPVIFRTCLESIPAMVPYLRADHHLVEHWKRELPKCNVRRSMVDVRIPASNLASRPLRLTRPFQIGIAWQGNPTYRHDRQRSIPPTHFERLSKVDGARLISLQKKPMAAQSFISPARTSNIEHRTSNSFLDFAPSLDEKSGAFMDTAALMMSLDLVISSDTAVAHLAGALGIPVWLALSLVPDWRWRLEREDSEWYPTMRLFRQTRRGQWGDVFDRIAEQLQALLGG
jgi:tetratricopeptide (TPR) repeat protein